jgi:hypothetical protein
MKGQNKMKNVVKQTDMTVTRNSEGWHVVTMVHDGLLITRKFCGYTARECKRMLQEELNIKSVAGW